MQALSTQSQPTPQSLAQAPMSQADADRKRIMAEAWKCYKGQFQKPLKVADNQPDDNVIVNRCAPIVDKGVSFLFGQVLKIEATDEVNDNGTDDDSPITEFLEGLWGDDDDKMTLLSQAAINGGVCGEVFLKLIPPQGQMKYPRIVVLDPLLLRIVTSPEDCSLTLAYIIEYPMYGDMQKRQIIARVDPDGLAGVAGEYDLDDSWTITNYMRKGQLGNWHQVGPQEQWNYPFAPIFCCQNLPNPNEAWGKPDLTPDIIEMNKVLNFMLSNISRIVKFHGHPKTWAKGLNASQMSMAVDDVLVLNSPDAQLGTLTPMENFAGLLNIVADLRSDMDEQSRVPAVALGRMESMPKGNISGVALQLLFQPLIEKTVMKQRVYGRLIREVSRAALVIGGLISLEEYEDYEIDLHWQSLLPADDLQAAQTALVLQQLGASSDTLLRNLGLDPDNEAEKKAKEDAQSLVNFSRGQGFPPQSDQESGQPMVAGQQSPMQTQQQGG